MDSAAHLKPGTEIAAWRVGERLCEGGMAVLYRVTSLAAGTAGLLKVPKLEFGSHPACYAGFEVEQMILGRIAGPHVPGLLASGESDCGPYLVMEEIAGTSLAALAAGAPLPAAEVARLGALIAFALHDLHRQDVVHHDLKPSHVILRADGTAALIDFGLAAHGQLPDLVEAESDLPLGTPAYIAPEPLAGVRGDPRSDVFSIGVVLYLLATAGLPFGEPTSVGGLRRRLYFDPLPPRGLVPDIPEWLQEIILHCLEVRADTRYATAAQVAHDLAHPDQVVLTERSRRLRRTGWPTGWLTAAQRWLAALGAAPPARKPPAAHLALAPHVLVAIDTGCNNEALLQAMRDATRRVIGGEQHWRVSCISVLETSLLTEQEEGAEIMRALHIQRLVELHHWAQPLGLAQERLRFHVLEGGDAAARIIEYAGASHADTIVIGARGSSGLRRFLGSVSSRVAAEAPCSVTVVRAASNARP